MTIQRRVRAKAIAATSDRVALGIYLSALALLIGGAVATLQHVRF